MRWAWITDWVLPYESNWSIVNRFCALNCISPRDMVADFCARPIHCTKTSKQMVLGKWNYNSDYLFDTPMYHLLVDGDFFRNSSLASIMPVSFIKSFSSYKYLRYCNSCLKLGYHFSIHQLLFIDKCPIHNVKLRTNCVKCNSKIKYEIDKGRSITFGCNKCKALFWEPYSARNFNKSLLQLQQSITKVSDIWNSLEKLKLKNCLTSDSDIGVWSRYYYKNAPKTVYQHLKDVSKLAFPAEVNVESERSFYHSMTFSFCIGENYHECGQKDLCNNFNSVLSLQRIFRSIKKHIFKKLLPKKHWKCYGKHCLIFSKYFSIHCPEINSIIMWLNFWCDCHSLKNLVYWSPDIESVEIIEDERLRNWFISHIFASQVYWSFWSNYQLLTVSTSKVRAYKDFKYRPPFWLVKSCDGRAFFHSWISREVVQKLQETSKSLFNRECGIKRRKGFTFSYKSVAPLGV